MNLLVEIRRRIGRALRVPWRSVRVTAERRELGWVVRVRCGLTRMRVLGGGDSPWEHKIRPLDGYLYGTSRTRGEALAWSLWLVRSYAHGGFRVFGHAAGRRSSPSTVPPHSGARPRMSRTIPACPAPA